MEIFGTYLSISETINSVFDVLATIVFLAWLALTVIRYTRKNIAKEGVGKGLYMGTMVGLEASALIFFIYFPLPQFLVSLTHNLLELATVRWILVYLVVIVWSYYVSHKNSERRGMLFAIIILTIVLFGWLYDHWVGILSMSMPILLIYLYTINKLAQVILPASNPDDRLETWKKTRVFLTYLLGVQHPIWMAESKTGRNLKKQVDGNTGSEIGKHGIVWTWSHQVVGIVKGVGLNRIEGPGLIFTDLREAPVELIDLRMQSRVFDVHTVTKDGIDVPTVVFMAFAIDKRNSATIAPSRRRPSNGGNFNIDHTEGSYAYSSGRVRAALSMAGINNPGLGEIEKHEFFWDEWVVKQAEHVTRLVVAERSLDELWHPLQDDLGASALKEIAIRLQELLSPQLAEVGINLITVRIVNYQLDKKPEIVQQNIKIWGSYWEQQIAETNADIEMIYREEIEKAHAYSKSMLLSAIADSIAKARMINKDLPRHMIAQYFIHALEEYMKGQPGLNISESKKQLETVREILMNSRMEGNE